MAAPKKLYFYNKSKARLLASEARVAESFVSRLVGLLQTPVLNPGDGLYIVPCSQIHMFGMKYAIDVVFMDKKGVVVGLCNKIAPGQMSGIYPKALGCLELPPGIIDSTGTCVGDIIESGAPQTAPGLT